MSSATATGCAVEDGDEISKLLSFTHPELRGGSRPLKHSFSLRQMKVLDAICDTLVPSLPVEASKQDNSAKAKFFELSASESGIVPEVAGMICAWTTAQQYFLIYIAFLMLSTRLGTLLLAGFSCVTTEFPFVQPFPLLELGKREKILLNWSRSIFHKLQMLFKVVKCYTLFKFYSRADKKGRNPAWKAIGYEVPEPVLEHEEPLPSPLERRLVDAKAPDFQSRLAELGCAMLDKVDHLEERNDPSTASGKDFGIKCDVVVVGSGSGGSVIAARLAQQGFKVVVLEKGGYFPRRGLSLLEGPSMKAMYEQSGALTTEDGSVILLAGTTLGGGSAVNWAASLKTPKHVLDEWTSLGLENRFGGPEYQHAMEAVCQRLGVQDGCTEESFQNRVLRRGCTEKGYSVGDIPRNAARDHGCGFCGFGCPAAAAVRKQSACDTWLCDAATAGAVVVTGCRVDRIVTAPQGGQGERSYRARGISSRAGEARFYVESRVTVAACGALFTPPLLRRSGGRNPHIGRHLSVHPVVAAWGYFPREDILPGNSYTGGIMTAFSSEAARWDTTGYGSILETPCVHPGNYAVLAPWRSGVDAKRQMLRFPRTATIIVLNRDRGRGTVDETPGGKLILDYPLCFSDRESLVEGTELAVRALVAAGAEAVGLHSVAGEIFSVDQSWTPLQREKELEIFLKRVLGRMFQRLSTPIISAHQMGSCRMGTDQRCSVVDPNCESWEVEGLFVGDGSVLPTASGVNPMITIQSIAHSTATRIARSLAAR
ncbi:long-chain-alcohol oxidase FAO4A [Selaginella moellendorffii]|nr:long-chain-alcohol oxidase FAO4A [Selaginella moellendorffii]XP_024527687.1 long-chain-alcohol oxidase FAO4A [Selaginella moellendorffii]XP_024527689.1 long-chain-alcohol oxidase FAO4A [Selaginella moellendorffii]|eukprot:XP_002967201.2 long-chain-alcohol oxidase FAO4A [Selaginella moellendorffii]